MTTVLSIRLVVHFLHTVFRVAWEVAWQSVLVFLTAMFCLVHTFFYHRVSCMTWALFFEDVGASNLSGLTSSWGYFHPRIGPWDSNWLNGWASCHMGMPGAKLTQAMKQNGESVMVAFKAGSLGRYLSNIRVEVSVKDGILKADGFTWHTSFLNKWFGSSTISEPLCSIVGTVRPSTNISTASVHFHILMVVPWPKFSRIAAFNLAFKQISDGFFRWWALNKKGWYLGRFSSKNLDLLMMLTLRFGASLRCEYGLCQSTLYRISDSEAAPWLNLFPCCGCGRSGVKKNRSTHWLFIIVDGKSEGKPCTFRGALLFGNYDHKHDWNLRIRCWIWFYCYVLPTFIQDITQWVAAVSATRCNHWGISEQPCWEVICVRSLLATEEMDINAPPDVLSVLDDGVDRKLRLVNTLMTGGMECQ